ncbi:hypothetical protein ACRRTK_021263 [Alexandromys fortis]
MAFRGRCSPPLVDNECSGVGSGNDPIYRRRVLFAPSVVSMELPLFLPFYWFMSGDSD